MLAVSDLQSTYRMLRLYDSDSRDGVCGDVRRWQWCRLRPKADPDGSANHKDAQ